MRNPIRRNRNIGTPKQGYGQDNKNVISNRWSDSRIFWEKLEEYTLVKRKINEKEYKFLVEKTRKTSVHPCTVDDVAKLLGWLKEEDLEGIDLIVFRQPKRKEELLRSVWGRLNYFVEIDEHEGPAIMLESFDMTRKIKWPKSLKVEDRKEFERLKSDGHEIEETKREHIIIPTIEGLRNTMLYRTFIHEVGHYVEYLEKVKRPSMINEDYDYWDDYDKIPSQEKETFAHTYASEVGKDLKEKGFIPFERIIDGESLERDGLEMDDFLV